MGWRRPSSSEIAAAYLEEGHRAYLEGGEPAYAVTVERALGLSPLDGATVCRDLETRGLITMDPFENALGAYRLTLRGQAIAEKMPALTHVIDDFTSAVNRSTASADDKHHATLIVREEFYKVAISKSVDAAIENRTTIWETLRSLYSSLPSDWRLPS
jgi:hypothetical protein